MSLNPKKLKVILTSIREAIADLEKSASPSAPSAAFCFCLLLVSELASRGAACASIDLPSDGSTCATNVEWIASLLESIRDVAGKVPIDATVGISGSGLFPPPMMAALNAASGMAASACATALLRDVSSVSSGDDGDDAMSMLNLLPMKNKTIKESVVDTMKRCLEVNDGRFYTLLKLAHDVSSAETQTLQQKVHQIQQDCTTIAYANYLYGATNFAMDQPPIWKRCLDASLLETKKLTDADGASTTTSNNSTTNYKAYQTSRTILPLQNMIRIAQSKGNDKRVKELSLMLAVGYLGGVSERLLERMKNENNNTAIANNNDDGKEKKKEKSKLDKLSMEQLLTTHYLHRASTFCEMEEYSTTKTLLDGAKEALASCDEPSKEIDTDNNCCDETWLLYHYVQVQIKHLTEESTIWMDVQRQHRAMLNRRPESGGGGISSGKGGGGGGGLSIGSSTKKSSTKSLGAKEAAPSASASTATTKEEMESETRTQVYLDAWTEWKTDSSGDLNALSPLAVRDAVMALSNCEGYAAAMDVVQDCYKLLIHQVDRMVEMAVIAQKQLKRRKGKKDALTPADVLRTWEAVVLFVSPLISIHLHPLVATDSGRINPLLRRLLECTAEAIICTSWMCEPYALHKDGGIVFKSLSESLLSKAYDCLSTCQKERSADEARMLEERKKEKSALSSKDGRSDLEKKELMLFQSALATSKCRMELENALNQEKVDISLTAVSRRATIAATASAKSSPDLKLSLSSSTLTSSSSNAKFGTPCMEFLSAWSGMYHSPSWPFCTLGQARTILGNARDSQSAAEKVWGRDAAASVIGQIMLDIGEADLEGSLLGGFRNMSEKLYRQALASMDEHEAQLGGSIKGKLKVHCLIGLAKLSLSIKSDDVAAAEDLARTALDVLSSLDSINGSECRVQLCIYPWSVPALNQQAHSHHMCACRQLIAEACIRSARPEDAHAFLSEAVKGEYYSWMFLQYVGASDTSNQLIHCMHWLDFPGNFEAAFALAAFHLRMMLSKDNDESESKKTRILLLKAAKMDTAKPGPFALLGVWYESQNDSIRAKGCYQKALVIDPCHPVAGRGVRRLMSLEEIQSLSEKAAKLNSPFNGWAWQILGQRKSRSDGDDSMAIVCYQQALRCGDIQTPEHDMLGCFYSSPTSSNNLYAGCEAGNTWSELAACYRRLGKYSAALRAYEAAYSISNGNLSAESFCAWAQVELDLGLHEEAAEKCDVVLSMESSSQIQRMATYIAGEALLFLARTDTLEGKFGSCLFHLERGVERLSTLTLNEISVDSHFCELKLLGDLYSFANVLPSYVFNPASPIEGEKEGEAKQLSLGVDNQLSFVKKGEAAYSLALELGQKDETNDEDENTYLIAAAATDLGTNLLSQATVASTALGEGSGGGTKTSLSDLAMHSSLVKDLITRSINAYLCAIDASPAEAPAWCGLGCALLAADPMLSQHAFSRALEIDPSLADSWSNIGLLYANFSTDKCSEILNYLTQVDDTPLMWIGRGFLLEKTSRAWKGQDLASEACLTKAADAYRAALQIMQHPAALLGLALTCRRADPGLQQNNNEVYTTLADNVSRSESMTSIAIHQNMTGEGNIGASFVSGLEQIEEGFERLQTSDKSDPMMIIDEAGALLNHTNTRSGGGKLPQAESDLVECEIDFSASTPLKEKRAAEFPLDLVQNMTDKTLPMPQKEEISLSPSPCSNGLDEARNIVHLNPESGELWLILAKVLAKELSSGVKGRNTLSSAKVAAQRAYDLLHGKVVNATLVSPRRQVQSQERSSLEISDKHVVSSIPSAALLSESISILSWLKEAESLNDDGVTNSSVAMQESYLLDPSNLIAASSLGLK